MCAIIIYIIFRFLLVYLITLYWDFVLQLQQPNYQGSWNVALVEGAAWVDHFVFWFSHQPSPLSMVSMSLLILQLVNKSNL